MGGILIGAAAMIFRFSIYSIVLFVIVYLIFRVHIRREEAELLERFGDSYRDYREKVPALHIRPRDLKVLIKFLVLTPS
jgi:protein-S-isoprenylcysteine O-methyltransferase Ste14